MYYKTEMISTYFGYVCLT